MLTAGPLPFPILIQEEVVKEVGGARLAGFNELLLCWHRTTEGRDSI